MASCPSCKKIHGSILLKSSLFQDILSLSENSSQPLDSLYFSLITQCFCTLNIPPKFKLKSSNPSFPTLETCTFEKKSFSFSSVNSDPNIQEENNLESLKPSLSFITFFNPFNPKNPYVEPHHILNKNMKNINPWPITCESISIGSSLIPDQMKSSLTWKSFAFPASSLVAIFNDSNVLTCETTLRKHKSFVKCLSWIESPLELYNSTYQIPALVSGDSLGNIYLWSRSKLGFATMKLQHSFSISSDSITSLATLFIDKNHIIVAASSLDGTITVLKISLEKKKKKKKHQFSVLRRYHTSNLAESLVLTCVGSAARDGIDNNANQIHSKDSNDSKKLYPFSISNNPQNFHPILFVGGVFATIEIYDLDSKITRPIHTLDGHSDWIRSLALIQTQMNTWYLASASQDATIRVYCLHWKKTHQFECIFDGLLTGHTDWIYSVAWHPKSRSQSLVLASFGMDKSICLWSPLLSGSLFSSDSIGRAEFPAPPKSSKGYSASQWSQVCRLGSLGGIPLGLISGCWIQNGLGLISYSADGHNFYFHLKSGINGQQKSLSDVKVTDWENLRCFTGHFKPVTYFDWDISGQFIVSCSQDKTCRILCPVSFKKNQTKPVQWVEIARPVVHGHSIHSIACIQKKNRFRIFVASEEKCIRVFDAPIPFLKTLSSYTGITFENDIYHRTHGAMLTALKISNKTLGKDSQNVFEYLFGSKDSNDSNDSNRLQLNSVLHRSTLWSETDKLYGHSNNVTYLCPSPDGKYCASGCWSKSVAHSGVRLWLSGSLRQLKPPPLSSDWSSEAEITHSEYCRQFYSSIGQNNLNTLDTDSSESSSKSQTLSSSKIYKHQLNKSMGGPLGAATHLSVAQRDNASKIQKALLHWYKQHQENELHPALSAHKLNIQACAFSKDIFISCSRDRSIALFSMRNPNDLSLDAFDLGPFESGPFILPKDLSISKSPLLPGIDSSESQQFSPFRLSFSVHNAHQKPITCCSISIDGKYLATGSRDKHLKIWEICRKTQITLELRFETLFKSPLSSLSFLNVEFSEQENNSVFIAVGLENGRMALWTRENTFSWKLYCFVPENLCHNAPISRIAWRPSNTKKSIQFCSSSMDQSIRIFSVDLGF